MKSHVSPEHPAGDWSDDAITLVDPGGPRAAKHRNLLRATLMYLGHMQVDEEERALWRQLTGKTDITSRALCDAIRESGINIAELFA